MNNINDYSIINNKNKQTKEHLHPANIALGKKITEKFEKFFSVENKHNYIKYFTEEEALIYRLESPHTRISAVQKKVVLHTGKTNSTIYNIRNGKSSNSSTIAEILDFLGLSFTYDIFSSISSIEAKKTYSVKESVKISEQKRRLIQKVIESDDEIINAIETLLDSMPDNTKSDLYKI